MKSLPAIIFSLVFLLIAGSGARAAAQQSPESEAALTSALARRIDSFFVNLKDPGVAAEDAFAELLHDGPFDPLDGSTEQLKAFVESYTKLEASFGRFLIAKQVHVKRVGDDLTFLTYLYETERFPIVWRFAFYRPPLDSLERPDWFVVRLSFDTKLEQVSNLP